MRKAPPTHRRTPCPCPTTRRSSPHRRSTPPWSPCAPAGSRSRAPASSCWSCWTRPPHRAPPSRSPPAGPATSPRCTATSGRSSRPASCGTPTAPAVPHAGPRPARCRRRRSASGAGAARRSTRPWPRSSGRSPSACSGSRRTSTTRRSAGSAAAAPPAPPPERRCRHATVGRVAKYRVEYIPEPELLPGELETRKLKRRVVTVAIALAVVGLIAAFAPGLGEVRDRLADAQPGWLALAVLLELCSCLSYVLMFKPIFCRRMTWRTSYELGMSELAAGSLVPASGAAGLALGAWALRKSGMSAEDIARRSVAFFVLKSGANFVAVAVLGVLMFAGVGPDLSPLLTLLPALLAIATIGLVAIVGVLAARRAPRERGEQHGWRRWLVLAVDALGEGVREAGRI